VDICSSRRIGNAPELRQLVSYEAHASFRLDPIGSVDYYSPNKQVLPGARCRFPTPHIEETQAAET